MRVADERQKLPRETPLDKLNKLIDFYEKFKPEAGKCIQVEMSPEQLAKALGRELPKDERGNKIYLAEQTYRGRTILCV